MKVYVQKNRLMGPDIILHNARIYTVDSRRPWASAAAIKRNWISAVGTDEEVLALRSRNTHQVDLENSFVMPGICDAHIHLFDWSMSLGQVVLSGCRSMAQLKESVREKAHKKGSGWLIGRGWNEKEWIEPVLPTRDDLDEVTRPDQPTLLWRSDMHCAVANSAALNFAGLSRSTSDPEGGRIGRDSSGHPNGLLWELAVNLVSQLVPAPSEKEIDKQLLNGISQLNKMGVTAVHDQRMKDQTEGPLTLGAYQRLRQAEKLTLRINSNVAAHDLQHLTSLGIRGGFGDDYLRIGHVKLFADGTMGSQTAWMLEPFLGTGEVVRTGINLTPPGQMAEEIRRASQHGLPISVHAIGDRANRVVLDIFEEISQSGPSLRIPHRIEHVQFIDPQDLERLAKLRLTASVQPVHVLDDMDTADLLLGDRAVNAYRFRSLAKSGALLALGSDAPVADANPFLGIHAALTRQRPGRMGQGPWYGRERLAVEQAIFGYTMGPALASGWQAAIGSISPGKRADMIVLDRNPFEVFDAGIYGEEMIQTAVKIVVFDGNIREY